MKLKEAIELFSDKQQFVYKDKLYEVINVKSISGNLVIVTKSKTFNLWESELPEFINNVTFDVALPEKKEFKPTHLPLQPNAEVLKNKNDRQNYLPVDVNGLMLPNSSMKAKDKLDELLALFDNPANITDDFMKKANALCTITDKIVSVEKLQLDFVKLQKI